MTIYIADYYNGHVRAVGPDGIIRDISADGQITFGTPTRVAYAARRGTLWIADSSSDKLIAFAVHKPPLVEPPVTGAPRRPPGSAIQQ